SDQHGDLSGVGRDRKVAQHFFMPVVFYQMFDCDHLCEILFCSARSFQNCEVSEARSSITFAPGNAARSCANRRSFSAGLSERNAIVGKSRRSTPNKSSSRCGRSLIPLPSRSSSVASSQKFPTPFTLQRVPETSEPPVSTGCKFFAKTFS